MVCYLGHIHRHRQAERQSEQDGKETHPKRTRNHATSSPLKNLVLDIDHNDSVIVIKTSPGAAQLIARLLDSIGKPEGILGTIAGDDTIFVTPTKDTTIKSLLGQIQTLFESNL